MEKLNGLACRDIRHRGRSGGISFGAREAADKTKADRIDHAPHHDGNGRGSVLRGGNYLVTHCDDYIGMQGDELVHESRNAFEQPVSLP